jgi:CheY-like chemotaxis protein
VEPSENSPRRLNVLVVDDNRDAADSTAALVEIWGHVARVAYDGVTGWQLIEEWHPDFLILDINMPGLDGYALAARVKQTPGLEGIRMAAVSAYSGEAHLRLVADAGFDYRLTKPADPGRLREILTMLERIRQLAAHTGDLAQQNVALVAETKELLQEVKEDMQEVKNGIKEVKEDIQELKEEIREIKDEKKDE